MDRDILDMFIEYFYQDDKSFDKIREEKFREKIIFARKHYKNTDKYLIQFYNKWCLNPNALVLPYGVFKDLFFTQWKDLGIMWVQHKKTEVLKNE